MKRTTSTVYFSSVSADRTEAGATLPAKLKRMLGKFDLPRLTQKDWVPIKMHLGGGLGYTTIHPLLVRTVANAVKEAGGRPFAVDCSFGAVAAAADRGYTTETLGCPIVAGGGPYDSHTVKRKIGYRSLDTANVLGAIWDAPCLINFSHVKGHGACGYGGACKNIAMGCVDGSTRGKIHALEGGIEWFKARCVLCGRCASACDTGAIRMDTENKKVSVFYHNCRYCGHCVSACPRDALTKRKGDWFKHFQEGMARTTKAVLDSFDPSRVLHINLLTNITMLCDCWGLSTPNIVPDIGVAASHDIVAIESASLDLIKVENFLPGTLIGGRKLVRGRHLFERIHGKDPWVQVRALERHGVGSTRYRLVEVP